MNLLQSKTPSKGCHIDAARTTNLPPLDQADVLRLWWEERPATHPTRAGDTADASDAPSPALAAGTRVTVFWTDMDRWFDGTVQRSRLEEADGGGTQRATQIVYDPIDNWVTAKQLTYWHCLDDETWQHLA